MISGFRITLSGHSECIGLLTPKIFPVTYYFAIIWSVSCSVVMLLLSRPIFSLGIFLPHHRTPQTVVLPKT